MTLTLLLFVAAILWRMANALALHQFNFCPLLAIAFCAGVYGEGTVRRWSTVAALVLSDLILNAYYGVNLLSPYTILAVVLYWAAARLGQSVPSNRPWSLLLAGTITSSFFFYLATNSLAWALDPYTKNLTGWFQALTTGLPGYSPTWTFFRNSVVSDLIFTVSCAILARVSQTIISQKPSSRPV